MPTGGGLPTREVYLLGGVCLLGDLPPGDPLETATSSGSHRSGQYASYWNAFLFGIFFVKDSMGMDFESNADFWWTQCV